MTQHFMLKELLLFLSYGNDIMVILKTTGFS
jgi:hypothetical protein